MKEETRNKQPSSEKTIFLSEQNAKGRDFIELISKKRIQKYALQQSNVFPTPYIQF